MTTKAWIFMLVTWGIIAFFTIKFFAMVLKAPMRDDDD